MPVMARETILAKLQLSTGRAMIMQTKKFKAIAFERTAESGS